MIKKNTGLQIHNLCKKLWPYNRSLTGNGTLRSLQILEKILKGSKFIK